MSTKRLVSTELGILGQLGIFFGWDGDSFPFYSGPMLSYVLSTELGIFGAAGYFRVGWKKFSIL